MRSFNWMVVAIAIMGSLSSGAAGQPSRASADLDATLANYIGASNQFYDGKPDAVKQLWSHEDDVTLSGAAGGETAKGWSEVSKRLEWASAQFSRGSKAVDLVHKFVSGNIAYVVQYEHILYYPPGKTTQLKRDYRVTTIFRREANGWRVVHRHADTLMVRNTIP